MEDLEWWENEPWWAQKEFDSHKGKHASETLLYESARLHRNFILEIYGYLMTIL